MKNILILFILALFYSCGNKKIENNEYVLSPKEQIKVSEILKDYSIIPLETVEDNIILDATEVKITKDRIFILDCFSPSKSLYVFHKDGKYIGKVGNVGNGPGEYVMPYGFIVNEKFNQLFIRDMMTNKLLVYDLSTLKYMEEYKIPFYAGCVELLNDERLIWYVNTGTQNKGAFAKHIQITDLKCNSISSHISPMDFPKRGLYNVMSYFCRINDKIYFHYPFMGEYYCCFPKDSILQSAFTLKFDKIPFPTKEYIIKHKNNIIKDLESDHYIQWCDMYQNSSTLLCYAGTGKELYWGEYDLKNRNGWYINREQIEDDLGIGKLGRPKTMYNEYFVNIVSLENEIPENSILKKYMNTEYRERNPILLLYKSFSIK